MQAAAIIVITLYARLLFATSAEGAVQSCYAVKSAAIHYSNQEAELSLYHSDLLNLRAGKPISGQYSLTQILGFDIRAISDLEGEKLSLQEKLSQLPALAPFSHEPAEEANGVAVLGVNEPDQECTDAIEAYAKAKAAVRKLESEVLSERLTVLNLSDEERHRIAERSVASKSEIDFGKKAENISKQVRSSTENMEEVTAKKKKIANEVKLAQDQESLLFAKEMLKIEEFRETVATLNHTLLRDLEQVSNRYSEISRESDQTDLFLSANNEISSDRIFQSLGKINAYWRELIDEGIKIYRVMQDESYKMKVPEVPENLLQKLSSKARLDIETSLNQARSELKKLTQSQNQRFETKVTNYFALLTKVSSIRSRLLIEAADESGGNPAYARNFGADFFREILAIPIRITGIGFAKYLEIKNDLGGGIPGLWEVFKKIVLLIFLLCIPRIVSQITKFIVNFVDSYRKNLIRSRNYNDYFSLRLAFWIQRLTPYVPWIVYLFFIYILDGYLEDSSLSEVRVIFPFVVYYILYRLFKLFINESLRVIIYNLNIERNTVKSLFESSSKVIGLFFLISFSIMHLTETSVDKGLVYETVLELMKVLGIIVCAYAINKWKDILAPAVEKAYPGKIGQYFSQKCQGRFSVVACLPAFIIVVAKIIALNFWHWITGLEVSKKILAKIYRKKVESFVKDKESQIEEWQLPEDYADYFSYQAKITDNNLVEANIKEFAVICKEIDAWLSGFEDDQSLAIYGEKGIGKTTILHRLKTAYADQGVVHISIPPKITEKSSLNNLLIEELHTEKTESVLRTVLEFNKAAEKKTIVLIDDAQNLFLGKVGAFEALKAMIEVVNLNAENIFWCLFFNEFSFAYIKGVLGAAKFFRTELRLEPWSDQLIKKLIMARHEQTEYELSYDKIILASHSAHQDDNAITYAEEQFFRLLWEQSSGNPRVALFLWQTCVSPSHTNSKLLKVGLPKRQKTESLAQVDDNTWFVIAAITTHENINRKEIAQATNLEIGPVSHALKLGMESKILHRDSLKRYRLNFSFQQDLIRQLKAKNFIYGLD